MGIESYSLTSRNQVYDYKSHGIRPFPDPWTVDMPVSCDSGLERSLMKAL